MTTATLPTVTLTYKDYGQPLWRRILFTRDGGDWHKTRLYP